MRHMTKHFIPATCATVLTFTASGQMSDRLMLDAGSAPLAVTPPAHATDVQRCTVNFDLIDELREGDLFWITMSGGDLLASVSRIEETADGDRNIAGTFDGMQGSSFLLARVDDAVAGWFFIPGMHETMRLRYGGPNGLHYTHRINQADMPNCPGAIKSDKGHDTTDIMKPVRLEDLPDRGDQGAGPLSGGCQPEDYLAFDIAVFYTDDARRAAGSTAAIQAEAAASVALTRETYARGYPFIDVIVPRLVHRSEINYAETNDTEEDLDNLIAGTAGLQATHTIRDQVAADFVVLLTDTDDECGLAPCLSDEDTAFSIVIWDCAVDNVAFPHEIGHNLGCDHDEDEGEGTGCYADWGLGRYFFVPAENMWRNTIMSYDNGIAADIPYYTHPQIQYMGVNTGDSGHDNVSVIFNRRVYCSGFRHTKMDVWVQFSYAGSENGSFRQPFNTMAEGVNRILQQPGMSHLPHLRVKAGSRAETITISKPMFIEACGGTVTIGR
ncbi:MAG: reprolysin-like metallopeptidase [Phycisphaerales bacterium]